MKNQLKWLLLIPIVALVVFLAIFVPKWLSSDGDDGSDNSSQNQAVQLEIEQKQEAIDAAQNLVNSDSQNTAALKSLGDANLEKGQLYEEAGDINSAYNSYKGAVDAYRAYMALVPNDIEVRIDLGYAYYNLGMFEVAERELKAAIDAGSTNQRGWLVYGFVLSGESKTSEAQAAWQKVIDIDPNTAFGQEAQQRLDQSKSGQIAVPSGS